MGRSSKTRGRCATCSCRSSDVGTATLAEIEIFHSRPIAPTRRIAIGHRDLPVDPAPGFGGVLLSAVVAQFAPALDADLYDDLLLLLRQLERGQRIPQP